MPINNIEQPYIINIDNTIRLKRYNGNYEIAVKWYQTPYIYRNSEGIFDDEKKPDETYVREMFEWLNNNGELYFIEVLVNNEYIPIGDVTIKDDNPPIAIWMEEYRGIGIGTKVMRIVINRLKELGYKKISGSNVYIWNIHSQSMHEKLGFKCVKKDDNQLFYELDLRSNR